MRGVLSLKLADKGGANDNTMTSSSAITGQLTFYVDFRNFFVNFCENDAFMLDSQV